MANYSKEHVKAYGDKNNQEQNPDDDGASLLVKPPLRLGVQQRYANAIEGVVKNRRHDPSFPSGKKWMFEQR